MKNYRLILASASPRRKELLQQIGVTFEVIPSHGEESLTTHSPAQAVLELSCQKATEVAAGIAASLPACPSQPPASPNTSPEPAIILGADTLVAFEGQILGKPHTPEEATSMLRMLAGHTHSVFTGVTILFLGQNLPSPLSFYEETKVTVSPMTEQQISAYVATGEPMDKAGAYGIQGRFAVHIQGISGDYNNVVGLPVARIYQEMRKSGIEILQDS